ncbi:MAG: hypothetical protein RL518_2557, partial [Pseudomonadota bacterium]
SLEHLREVNAGIRERIAQLYYGEIKGVFARCTAWLTSALKPKDMLSATREQLEKQLSDNVKQIRRFTEKVVQPKVDVIRRKYEGKTFERTEDTPRLLVLASVPTEKVGKIPSHASLFSTIIGHVESGRLLGVKVVARDGDNSITITRRNKDNEEETIRLSYRRPGKVDAEIIGADGTMGGPFWNDDALKLVLAFSTGRNLSVKPAKFKSYTVV